MGTRSELATAMRFCFPSSVPAFAARRLVYGSQSPGCWCLVQWPLPPRHCLVQWPLPLRHCSYHHLACWTRPWKKPKFVEKVRTAILSRITISWGSESGVGAEKTHSPVLTVLAAVPCPAECSELGPRTQLLPNLLISSNFLKPDSRFLSLGGVQGSLLWLPGMSLPSSAGQGRSGSLVV